MKKLKIFDTTLRDGIQAPGNELDLEKRQYLLPKIDSIGIDYIEIGFPASSSLDYELAKIASQHVKRAKICAFCRANRQDVDKTLAAFTHRDNLQLQILLTGSEIHLTHKRRLSEKEVLKEGLDTVKYVKAQGITDISLGMEDASRASYDYLKRMIVPLVECGGTTVALADTVGCAIPAEFSDLIMNVKSYLGESILLSVHCHNDMGLAVANTLAAVKAGADVVQTTFCGIGERAGNTPLEEILTVLHYKKDYYQRFSNIQLQAVYAVGQTLLDMLNLPPWKHKPIFGSCAFSTAAGIHVNGMVHDPKTYEYVEPTLFGRQREFLINNASGKKGIEVKLKNMGFATNEIIVNKLYQWLKSSKKAVLYHDNKTFLTALKQVLQDEDIQKINIV